MTWMDTSAFDFMLSDLGTRLRWSRSHKCPCVGNGGGAEAECPVCDGLGLYWDVPSAEFRAGVVGLSSQDVARQQAKAEGLIGDGQVSFSTSALCYGLTKPGDRFLAVDAIDSVEWLISARAPVRLPAGAEVVSVNSISSGKIVPGTLPAPGADGRIRVVRPATVLLRVPRQFEIIDALGQIRAWQPGLPQRFAFRRIDVTTR